MASSTTPLPAIGLVMPLASQQGGAECLFQHLLQARNHTLRYTCMFLQDGPLVGEARAMGYETAVLATTHLSDLRNYVTTVKELRHWIKRSEIDLVFSWMLKADLYAGPAALSLHKKRMWFQHGISKRHWMDVVSACIPAEGIFCCSGYVKDKQDEHLVRSPTVVCHPGVPVMSHDAISRTDARLRLGLRPDGQVICMVARLERWKGAHVFIEAARCLAARFPQAYFVVVGGAHPLNRSYADEIEHLSQISNLGERLYIAGQRPAAEIPLWHASADIVVHPVTEAEPFGMAVVEAMAAGRAVIASRAGGIGEIIEDGVSGVFVTPGDAPALASAIGALLLDPGARRRLERAAVLRSRTFTVDAFAARFELLVTSALAA